MIPMNPAIKSIPAHGGTPRINKPVPYIAAIIREVRAAQLFNVAGNLKRLPRFCRGSLGEPHPFFPKLSNIRQQFTSGWPIIGFRF